MRLPTVREERDLMAIAMTQERRARRRLVSNAPVGALVGLVVLVGALAGVRAIQTAAPIPADPPVEPRPAPAASGTLAYGLDGDIYVADWDGANAVKIANGRSDDECSGDSTGENYSAEGPMWSPDGRYLAYRYADCSNPEFLGGGVISDAEGNVLARFPRQGWEIAWSPDSTRVAVWAVTFETIGVYGLDGARQAQLTMPPGWTPSGDHDPKWMPDGTSFWVEDWELPLDGSPPRRLPWRGGDPYATYSPDGSLVAYDLGSIGLMVTRPDGSEPRRVFPRQVEPAADWGHPWSPTGDRIAFTTQVGGPAAPVDLNVVDVATGSVTQLAEGEPGESLQAVGFSPQGDRILFSSTSSTLVRSGRLVESSLWSIGVDGSDPRVIVAGTEDGYWLSR
jgi:Tol biopolymer transport system component